jgi:hypothetical protein
LIEFLLKMPRHLLSTASCLACLVLGFWLGRRGAIGKSDRTETVETPAILRPEPDIMRPAAEETSGAPVSRIFSLPQSGSLSARLDAVRNQGMPFSAAAALVLISQMKAGETQGVYEWLAQNAQGSAFGSSKELGPLWQAYWMRHGEIDLDGALAKSKLPAGTHFGADRVLKHIFEGMAKADPAAAGQALAKLSDPGDIAWAVEGLAVRWAEMDSAAATLWSLKQEDPEFRRNALRMVPFGIHNSGHGPAALTAWWQSLPPEDRAAGWSMASQPLKENPDSVNLNPAELWDFLQAGRSAGLDDARIESIWDSAAARWDKDRAMKLPGTHPLDRPAARPMLKSDE